MIVNRAVRQLCRATRTGFTYGQWLTLLIWLACMSDPCWSQNEPLLAEDNYAAGSSSVSLTYQTIKVSEFNTGISTVDIGLVRTHSVYLELEHALSDRWLIKLAAPYIIKKYEGPARHDPLTLDPPRPDVPYIDDGQYRGSLQDFLIGVRYLLDSQPLIIEPFIYFLYPSHEYPHFGQAAVGQNLWKLEAGFEATHFLPFSNWFYRFGLGYTLVEKTLGVNVNHFRLGAEVGYFITPDCALKVFALGKYGNGDDAFNFPPSKRTDERWYQHDRTTRHNYINSGIAVDWFFGERFEVSAAVLTTVWGESVHLVDYSASLGITRYFGS